MLTSFARRLKVSILNAPGRTLALGLAASLLLNHSALSQKVLSDRADALVIGVLLPPEEPQARTLREGVLLANKQYTEKTGTELRVSIRGRVGQWGADAVEAARLVTDESAAGLIAPPDGAASHLVLQVSGRTAVPVVTLCADGSVGRTGVPWLLRMVPRTEDEAKALSFGLLTMGPVHNQRWMAVVPALRPGREIGKDLLKTFRASSCQIVQLFEYASTNQAHLTAELQRADPDAILVWLPPAEAGAVVMNLRRCGYKGRLAGPGLLQCSAFLDCAGTAAEGFFVPAMVRSQEASERWQRFSSAYTREWGEVPDVMSALSYDAVRLLADLLQNPGFQVPPHRLPPGFCWQGVTGDVSFDSEGNRKIQLELLQVTGGRFVPAKKSR
jgi:ABC-type branched-subunit amino acid transport system substrate-binding protein